MFGGLVYRDARRNALSTHYSLTQRQKPVLVSQVNPSEMQESGSVPWEFGVADSGAELTTSHSAESRFSFSSGSLVSDYSCAGLLNKGEALHVTLRGILWILHFAVTISIQSKALQSQFVSIAPMLMRKPSRRFRHHILPVVLLFWPRRLVQDVGDGRLEFQLGPLSRSTTRIRAHGQNLASNFASSEPLWEVLKTSLQGIVAI